MTKFDDGIEEEAAMYHDMPKEELQAVWDFLRAGERGDYEEAERQLLKIRIDPGVLMATKELEGADFVRQHYNTELADKKYGPGWLDE